MTCDLTAFNVLPYESFPKTAGNKSGGELPGLFPRIQQQRIRFCTLLSLSIWTAGGSSPPTSNHPS